MARFAILSQQRLAGVPTRQSIWSNVNGAPALVIDTAPPPGADLPARIVLSCDVDHAGRVTRFYVLAAPAKLSHLQASEGLGLHQVDNQAHHAGDGPRESPQRAR